MPNAKVLSEKQAIVAELVERLKGASCNSGGLSQSLSQEDPLEESIATHSSTVASRIPGAWLLSM